jgi:hypothetical protein
MVLVDSVKDFWVKKILMPKVFRMDIPGYVVGKFYTLEGQNAFVRNVFMPENFFSGLEFIVKRDLGPEGLARLYAASKRFGYGFAALNKLPKMNVGMAVDLVTRFFESLYAEELKSTLDTKAKYVELHSKGLFVTRLSGGGESLTVGGWAGVCSYIFSDFNNMDCGVIKSGVEYDLVCSTDKLLDDRKIPHFTFQEKVDQTDLKYKQFNTPTIQSSQSKFSLSKLMETGLFSYQKGSLKFSLYDIRFAPVEISLAYLYENYIEGKVIYEAAKTAFEDIGEHLKKQDNVYLFLANLFTVLGYGVVSITRSGDRIIINFDGFPWYPKCDSSSLPLVKGMVEGFLKGQKADKSDIDKTETSLLKDRFVISITVK